MGAGLSLYIAALCILVAIDPDMSIKQFASAHDR
jgi:hypothetical protein